MYIGVSCVHAPSAIRNSTKIPSRARKHDPEAGNTCRFHLDQTVARRRATEPLKGNDALVLPATVTAADTSYHQVLLLGV
jgi:hypothetical protein